MNINSFLRFILLITAASSLYFPHSLVVWFLGVNLLTLGLYGLDKIAARRGWRRVSEMTLLLFGVVGGWPGAMIGQQLFRHKTQKQPFKSYFVLSVVLNIVMLVVLYFLFRP